MRQGSTFVISILLARILDPAEFGLIGMAMVFITISQVFVDVGFSSSLIQAKNVSKLACTSVFFLNLLLGTFFFVIIFALAPAIGNFYKSADIVTIVRYLSIVVLIGSFSPVQSALLRRKLKFKALTLKTLAGSLIGGILGLICALNDFGVYSLIVQQVTSVLVITTLLWLGSDWKPTLNFSLKEIRDLSSFSIFVFLDRISNSIFQKIDTLFIGKVFSASMLGFYSRAESMNHQITLYSSASLRKVFLPVLSSIQNDHSRFKSVYFNAISLASFISFGLVGVVYFLAEPLILILLGEKWRFSILIFQILIFKASVNPISSLMINALLSKGKAKENFKIGLVRKLIRLFPILPGFLYGIIPFTIAVSVISFVLVVYNAIVISKHLEIDLRNQFLRIFENSIPLVICGLINYFGLVNFDPVLNSLFFVLVFVLYSFILKTNGFLLFSNEIKSRICKT